jgi:hypothetical protein
MRNSMVLHPGMLKDGHIPIVQRRKEAKDKTLRTRLEYNRPAMKQGRGRQAARGPLPQRPSSSHFANGTEW